MNFNNQRKYIKPYKVKNMISRKLNIQATQPEDNMVGYVSIRVFTASRALPVPNAVVTIYDIREDGLEHVLYHLVSDRSGNVPKVTLPVMHGERKYEFTKYNIRIQAINYYTTNIVDVRIFPDTTTSFTINLVPTAYGRSEEDNQTIIIPSIPLDITN